MKPQEAMQLLSGEAENSGLQIRQQSDELHPVSSKGAGSGAGKTYTEAEINFQKAAAEGDAEAKYRLGYRYQHGKGVPQDLTEALRWYRGAGLGRYARSYVHPLW